MPCSAAATVLAVGAFTTKHPYSLAAAVGRGARGYAARQHAYVGLCRPQPGPHPLTREVHIVDAHARAPHHLEPPLRSGRKGWAVGASVGPGDDGSCVRSPRTPRTLAASNTSRVTLVAERMTSASHRLRWGHGVLHVSACSAHGSACKLSKYSHT